MANSFAALVDRAKRLPAAIGADLQQFGGILRCRHCGREEPLGDAGQHIAHGWPKCCGYTMRWVTQKELDEEKAGASRV